MTEEDDSVEEAFRSVVGGESGWKMHGGMTKDREAWAA